MQVSRDLFEEIAKLRAFRRLWAKTFKEKFNCQDPRSLQIRMMVQTAGSSLTRQQPLLNIARVAIEALGAVLGGADSIWTCSHDEEYEIPSREAALIALRTQQMILEETNIPKVSDPLAGSYYLEWLTNQIEQEATKFLKRIDELGGYIRCWETGWFKGETERNAKDYRAKFEKGEEIVVGVNKYTGAVSEESQKVQLFKYDPGWEESVRERVILYKERRDNAKTEAALANLKNICKKVDEEWPKGPDLMPALIETARAETTFGEMMIVLKEVFGYGYAY
jgi:methylmalonyl-CoA mutase N-terminal domain/subunit